MVARAKLSEYLDSKKLRKTPERFAILDVVFSHNDHFGVETIFAEMEENSYHVSRSTVYNTMELFCDCGIVRKHQFGTQKALYEKVVSSGNHHHLICRKCNKVIPFTDDLLDDLEHHIEEVTGFHVLDHELKFYGFCRDCMEKEN